MLGAEIPLHIKRDAVSTGIYRVSNDIPRIDVSPEIDGTPKVE
jgi:hypothetical protein